MTKNTSAPSQKGRIFISYRRIDSAGYAGRIYDRFVAYFGEDAIFMDVDTIEGGTDFIKTLEEAVQCCDVLIALIGRQWLNIRDKGGERRLDNPEDFVRIEIATALKRNIRVIPVLVDGIDMPQPTDLPENLKALARRNALQVNHQSFNPDVYRLIEHSKSALDEAEESRVRKVQALQVAREKAESEAAEKAAREKAEQKAKETAEREAAKRARLEADEQAKQKAAKEEVEQREEYEKLTKEKEAREKVAREKKERETFEKTKSRATKPNLVEQKTAIGTHPVQRKPAIPVAFWAIGFVAVIFALGMLVTNGGNQTASPTYTMLIEASKTATEAMIPSTTNLAENTTTPVETVLASETPSPFAEIGYMQGYESSLALYVGSVNRIPSKVVDKQLDARDGRIAVSENGQYLAWSGDGIIYYINLFTGEEGPLVSSVFQRDYQNLAWSPDGGYVFALVHGEYTTAQWWQSSTYHYWTKGYIISTANLEVTEVFDKTDYHSIKNPRWSPNNKGLAYWESGDIFLINVETKQIENLTKKGIVSDIPFDWSPDGTRIVFAMTDPYSILLLDIESGEKTSLVDGLNILPLDITWSHNGKKIVYTLSNQIHVIEVQTRIDTLVVEGRSPVWSPDDSRLLFLNNGDVFLLDMASLAETSIVDSTSDLIFGPFWLDSGSPFEIKTEETVSESFGSGSTFCSWGQGDEPTGTWQHYQCSCDEVACACDVKVYESPTKRDRVLGATKLNISRGNVDNNVAKYSGKCEEMK